VKTSRSNCSLSDKVDFRKESVRRDEDHYILIKGTIQEEDITTLNIYSLSEPPHSQNTNTSELKRTDRTTSQQPTLQ
jgi:hypothetical protein